MNSVSGASTHLKISSVPGAAVAVTSGISAIARLILARTVLADTNLEMGANALQGFAGAYHSYSAWDVSRQIGDREGQQFAIFEGISATSQMAAGLACAVKRISSVASVLSGFGGVLADTAGMVGALSWNIMYTCKSIGRIYTCYYTHRFQAELLGPHKTTAEKIDALRQQYFNPYLDNHQALEAILCRYIGEDGVRQLKKLDVLIDQEDVSQADLEFLHGGFEEVFSAIEQKRKADQSGLISFCLLGLVMGMIRDMILVADIPVLSLSCLAFMLMKDYKLYLAGLACPGQIGAWDKLYAGVHAGSGILAAAGVITLLVTKGVAAFGMPHAVAVLALCAGWVALHSFTYHRLVQNEKAYDLAHPTLERIQALISHRTPKGTLDQPTVDLVRRLTSQDLDKVLPSITNFYWCGVFNDVSTLFTAPIDQLTTEQVSDLLDAVQDLYKQQPSILLYKMEKKLLEAPRTHTSLAEYCGPVYTLPDHLQAAYDRRAAIRRLTYNELQSPSPNGFLCRAARSRIPNPFRLIGGIGEWGRGVLPQVRRAVPSLKGLVTSLPGEIVKCVELATTTPPYLRIQWELMRLDKERSSSHQIGLLPLFEKSQPPKWAVTPWRQSPLAARYIKIEGYQLHSLIQRRGGLCSGLRFS